MDAGRLRQCTHMARVNQYIELVVLQPCLTVGPLLPRLQPVMLRSRAVYMPFLSLSHPTTAHVWEVITNCVNFV